MGREKLYGRVLVAIPSDDLGGAEQFLKMIAAFFLKNGKEVVVICLKKRRFGGWDDIEADSRATIHFGKYDSEFKGFFELWHTGMGMKGNYDYVFSSHVHVTGFMGIMIKKRRLRTTFFIGRESTSIFKRFKGIKLFVFTKFYTKGYPKLDLLICQTNVMKRQFVEALPKLAEKLKVEVISNPLDLEAIKGKSTEEVDTTTLGDYLISAGRLIHLKGYDLLIKAFAQLSDPSLKLVILGKGSEKENLEVIIAQEQLEQRVFLLGQVENVYPYFKNAKACVVSSRIEGFPNVLLQMMSQNTKVVSTTCAGGIEDIPGIFPCETESTEALKHAVEKAVGEDTEENRAVFDAFLKERSIDQFVKKVEELARK